jgi:hypothetical protein
MQQLNACTTDARVVDSCAVGSAPNCFFVALLGVRVSAHNLYSF